jgi:hypothetical protein
MPSLSLPQRPTNVLHRTRCGVGREARVGRVCRYPQGATCGDSGLHKGFSKAGREGYGSDQTSLCSHRFRRGRLRHLFQQRFYREIVGWKYITHPNVLPVIGISETPPPFCIITPWMPNGNIVEYTRQNPDINRLLLVGVEMLSEDQTSDRITDSSRNRPVVSSISIHQISFTVILIR